MTPTAPPSRASSEQAASPPAPPARHLSVPCASHDWAVDEAVSVPTGMVLGYIGLRAYELYEAWRIGQMPVSTARTFPHSYVFVACRVIRNMQPDPQLTRRRVGTAGGAEAGAAATAAAATTAAGWHHHKASSPVPPHFCPRAVSLRLSPCLCCRWAGDLTVGPPVVSTCQILSKSLWAYQEVHNFGNQCH